MVIPSNARLIWDWFKEKTNIPDFGIAGLMGNLYAESGLVVNRKQGDFTAGYTRSSSYTLDVDTGVIPKSVFTKDSIGYGLAQWTYYTRKDGLYDYAKQRNTSIGFLDTQLGFLMDEMKLDYKKVYSALCTADNVRGASDFVLKFYEQPADQSVNVQIQRAGFGQAFYDAFHGLDVEKQRTDEAFTLIAEIRERLTKLEKLI